MAASALARMHQDVANARSAAAGHDPGQVRAALGSLQRDVVALRGSGGLSGARAHILLTEVQQAQARVAADVVAPPAAAVAAPVTPAPAADGNGNGNDKGKGKGNGNGKGQGDGGGGGGD